MKNDPWVDAGLSAILILSGAAAAGSLLLGDAKPDGNKYPDYQAIAGEAPTGLSYSRDKLNGNICYIYKDSSGVSNDCFVDVAPIELPAEPEQETY